MHDGKTTNRERTLLLSSTDPLGIKEVTLGGGSPSLQVEARIAVRQWATQNGTTEKGKPGERPHGKT